jgi:Ca2+-binding EF-hand superfamily protein
MKRSIIKILTLTIASGLFVAPLFGDTQQDPKEAERKAKTFLKFDVDGDKMLNEEEFTAMTKSWFEKSGKDGYEKAAKRRFKNKDVDGDGFVSFKEQFGMDLPG